MRTQGYFKHEEDGLLNSNVSLTELGQCEFIDTSRVLTLSSSALHDPRLTVTMVKHCQQKRKQNAKQVFIHNWIMTEWPDGSDDSKSEWTEEIL